VQIRLSNGMGQMELSCVGSNQNRTPTLGLRKLDPKEEASKVSLRGHAHALKCILDGWLVVAANARSHDPVRVL
jgi:hypothetical protein